MIDKIATDIATQLLATLPFVKEVKHIARQDPSGILIKEGPEEWAGIDDRKEGRLYLRFRDGWDEMIASGTLISARNMESTARLRGVFMHYCDNELEIARFLAFGIMNCVSEPLRYRVRVRSKSTDKQFIYAQETKRTEGMKDDTLRLIMIDFDVMYKDALLLNPECLPACDVC